MWRPKIVFTTTTKNALDSTKIILQICQPRKNISFFVFPPVFLETDLLISHLTRDKPSDLLQSFYEYFRWSMRPSQVMGHTLIALNRSFYHLDAIYDMFFARFFPLATKTHSRLWFLEMVGGRLRWSPHLFCQFYAGWKLVLDCTWPYAHSLSQSVSQLSVPNKTLNRTL